VVAASGTTATGVETITLTSGADWLDYQLAMPTGGTSVTTTGSVSGEDGADFIRITLNDNGGATGNVNIAIYGGAGNDTITVADNVTSLDSGETSTLYIIGGAGADTIQLGGHTLSTEIDVVRFNLASDLVAASTARTDADRIDNFASGDQIDLAAFTLVSGSGAQLSLQASSGLAATTNKDDFSGSRTVSGNAASFANLTTGGNENALVLFIQDGGTATFTTDAAVNAARDLIINNVGTASSGVGASQKIIIVVQSTTGNSNAMFLYQEAGTNGIQAGELTLIGVVNGKTLAAGDLG